MKKKVKSKSTDTYVSKSYYDIAREYGIYSGKAYGYLFENHFHKDTVLKGTPLVTQTDALKAIKMAEEEMLRRIKIVIDYGLSPIKPKIKL